MFKKRRVRVGKRKHEVYKPQNTKFNIIFAEHKKANSQKLEAKS